MTEKTNDIFKSILCLIIAILISLTQLQFFGDGEIFSIVFLLILAITVPIIYLYFLPKHDTLIFFIYIIILVFILDIFGKSVSIKLFLLSLFSVSLLYLQSLFIENVKRFKIEKANFKTYAVILTIIISIVVLISFVIYENLLKKIEDKNELSLAYERYEEITLQKVETDESYFDTASENKVAEGGSGGGGGGEKQEQKLNISRFFIIAFLSIILLCIIYFIYKIIRYKIWLKKTLNASNNEKVYRIYLYTLNYLRLYGIEREIYETPLEYLKISNDAKFPFLKDEFRYLTETFVSAYYGNDELSKEKCENCLKFFFSIPNKLKEKYGVKKYIYYKFRLIIKN